MVAIFTILLMFATWTFFLAVMHLRIVRDTVGFSRWNQTPAWIVLLIGVLLDMALNLVMCLWLLDLPKELLLTGKLSRLIKEDMGWRGDVSEWICQNFLVPADKGHCS